MKLVFLGAWWFAFWTNAAVASVPDRSEGYTDTVQHQFDSAQQPGTADPWFNPANNNPAASEPVLLASQPAASETKVSHREVAPSQTTTTQEREHPVSRKSETYALIIGILSSPNHFELRQGVRDSWMKLVNAPTPNPGLGGSLEDMPMKAFFIVGYHASNQTLNDLVREEATQYGDIAWVPVKEAYENLTMKGLEFMRWSLKRYQFVYLMKTDDDSFVRADKIRAELAPMPRQRMWKGWLWTDAVPPPQSDRNWMGDQWSGSQYPPYMSGCAYFMSFDLVQYLGDKFTKESREAHFKVEDVAMGLMLEPLQLEGRHDGRIRCQHGRHNCEEHMLVLNPATPDEMKVLYEDHGLNDVCARFNRDSFNPGEDKETYKL